MPLTPVAPTISQTDRQDLNDFLMAMIAAFQAAQPGVVRKAWSEIPASVTGEMPLVYLGPINEVISVNDNGIRVRRFEGVIGYLDRSPDNPEANNRANIFADFFIEWFTANPHGPNATANLQQTGLTDGAPSIPVPQIALMAFEVSYFYSVQQGRQAP